MAVGLLGGLGQEAMIFEGETMSDFTGGLEDCKRRPQMISVALSSAHSGPLCGIRLVLGYGVRGGGR